LFKVELYSNVGDHGYMYGLKTPPTKQTKSHFINMDIKINSMASVTVVNICQLVDPGPASLQIREILWHPGYNWCGPFIEINIGQIRLN